MTSEEEIKQRLQELQKQLGKKQMFEESLSSIRSLLLQHYPSSSASLKHSFYGAVCRVSVILKTRYTSPGFWSTGIKLFQEAEHLVSNASEKKHFQSCISQAREHLAELDNPPMDSTSNNRGYLFEGHLTNEFEVLRNRYETPHSFKDTPILQRSEYEVWRNTFMNILEAKDHGYLVIESITHGPAQYWRTTPGAPDNNPPIPEIRRLKTMDEYSDYERLRVKADKLAMIYLQQALPNIILSVVDGMQSAKEMWDEIYKIMCVMDVVIQAKMVRTLNEYDCFKAIPGESLSDTYHRFLVIVYELRKINVTRTNMDYNVRFLNSLLPEWKYVAMMLRSNKDFAQMNLYTVHANLSLHRDYIVNSPLTNHGKSAAEESSAFLTEYANREYSHSHKDMGTNFDLQRPVESEHFDDPESDPEIHELSTQMVLLSHKLNSKLQRRFLSSNNKFRTTSFLVQRDAPLDMGRGYTRDISSGYPRDMQREYAREMPRDYPREIPGEYPRELPREYPRDLSRESNVPRVEQLMQPKKITSNDRSWNCYNCGKPGHNAKDCRLPKHKGKDYYIKKALLAEQKEAGIVLFAEQEDWLNDTSDSDTDVAQPAKKFAHSAFMAKLEHYPERDGSCESDTDWGFPDEKVNADTEHCVVLSCMKAMEVRSSPNSGESITERASRKGTEP